MRCVFEPVGTGADKDRLPRTRYVWDARPKKLIWLKQITLTFFLFSYAHAFQDADASSDFISICRQEYKMGKCED